MKNWHVCLSVCLCLLVCTYTYASNIKTVARKLFSSIQILILPPPNISKKRGRSLEKEGRGKRTSLPGFLVIAVAAVAAVVVLQLCRGPRPGAAVAGPGAAAVTVAVIVPAAAVRGRPLHRRRPGNQVEARHYGLENI